jgi:Predicted transcriptional regulator containing an HTH domain and an uncharacterized domain shared with the mammalian protein Schlafen
MVSTKQIEELIKQGETTTIEFKSCTDKVSGSVYETVCAFLNREGGHIIIGVDDNGTIIGVNKKCAEDMVKNLINTMNNPQFFIPIAFLTPEIIEIDDKLIIYLNVPESSQVHRYKGKYYDRVGDADNDISQSFYLVDNIHLRKRKESSENEVFPYLTMDDFDNDTFKTMRAHIAIHNERHPWLTMSNEEVLHSSFWKKDLLTNKEGFIMAAILLFGKENSLLSCCPFHRTDAIYRNMSYERYLHPLPTDPDVRYHDRDMVCSNLIESYSRLMKFVDRNMPDKFRLDEQNINRIDVRNLIFREVVANMLVHREYAHAFSAKLLIFSDRVITENWTKPMQYGNVTIDNWESHTKNPLITKVFREMKWVEELGSGKKNIKKYAPLYYEDYQIEIQDNEKFVFMMTYRNPQEFMLDADKRPTNDQQLTDKSPISHRQVTDKLGISWDVVKIVLSFCEEAKPNSEIIIEAGFKDRVTFMKKYIKPLIAEELLAMSVPDKPNSRLQKYYTTEKGKLLIWPVGKSKK